MLLHIDFDKADLAGLLLVNAEGRHAVLLNLESVEIYYNTGQGVERMSSPERNTQGESSRGFGHRCAPHCDIGQKPGEAGGQLGDRLIGVNMSGIPSHEIGIGS